MRSCRQLTAKCEFSWAGEATEVWRRHYLWLLLPLKRLCGKWECLSSPIALLFITQRAPPCQRDWLVFEAVTLSPSKAKEQWCPLHLESYPRGTELLSRSGGGGGLPGLSATFLRCLLSEAAFYWRSLVSFSMLSRLLWQLEEPLYPPFPFSSSSFIRITFPLCLSCPHERHSQSLLI